MEFYSLFHFLYLNRLKGLKSRILATSRDFFGRISGYDFRTAVFAFSLTQNFTEEILNSNGAAIFFGIKKKTLSNSLLAKLLV